MPLRLSAAEAARMGLDVPSPPSRKYRNAPVSIGTQRFDSELEARRWGELVLLERAGQIRDLQRQVRFALVATVRLPGAKRRTPAIEDVKGMRTRVYKMKRHLMKSVLGLDIEEVGARR